MSDFLRDVASDAQGVEVAVLECRDRVGGGFHDGLAVVEGRVQDGRDAGRLRSRLFEVRMRLLKTLFLPSWLSLHRDMISPRKGLVAKHR